MIPFDKRFTSSLIFPFCYFMFPPKGRPCFACKATKADHIHYDKKSINRYTHRKHREMTPYECVQHSNTPVCSCPCSDKRGFRHNRFNDHEVEV